jgi:beta-phosphoglucomutase-like phosphatase (HAD superfamily)
VFEDAFVGLEAARAGGFKSIGVGTTNPVATLRPHCDRAMHRLNELNAVDVMALAQGG